MSFELASEAAAFVLRVMTKDEMWMLLLTRTLKLELALVARSS
jgi:hypothetical protein